MINKLVAELGTRVFSFTVTELKPNELVAIEMYNTRYTLIKKSEQWENHSSNKMDMSPELIQEVVHKAQSA